MRSQGMASWLMLYSTFSNSTCMHEWQLNDNTSSANRMLQVQQLQQWLFHFKNIIGLSNSKLQRHDCLMPQLNNTAEQGLAKC